MDSILSESDSETEDMPKKRQEKIRKHISKNIEMNWS